jgi:hypothetical protein
MKLDFGKILKSLFKALMPFYKPEIALLITIIADVRNEGLKDDAAFKEVQRRFRKEWKGVMRDSVLNFLIEALVLNAKF